MLNKKGKITSYFLIFYSLFRFILEFFREPDPQLGYLIIGMTVITNHLTKYIKYILTLLIIPITFKIHIVLNLHL